MLLAGGPDFHRSISLFTWLQDRLPTADIVLVDLNGWMQRLGIWDLFDLLAQEAGVNHYVVRLSNPDTSGGAMHFMDECPPPSMAQITCNTVVAPFSWISVTIAVSSTSRWRTN